MKKVFLIILGVVAFLVGINNISAALVAGDDVYHFDLTMNKKEIINFYDSLVSRCIMYYSRNIDPSYTEVWNYDNGAAFITMGHNNKDLFTWAYDYGYIDRLSTANESDNFVIDVTDLDSNKCPLKDYGYNKLAVYFESDEQIPVVDYYTFDMTKMTELSIAREFDMYILQLLFFIADDSITPDITDMNDLDNPPLVLSKDGVEFFKIDMDDNGDAYTQLLNPDKFTTDDNFVLTKDFLLNATLTTNDSDILDMVDYFTTVFSKINVIISHNEPVQQDPIVNPEKEEQKQEEKNEETEQNPKTGDNLYWYLSLLGVSSIGTYFFIKESKSNKKA